MWAVAGVVVREEVGAKGGEGNGSPGRGGGKLACIPWYTYVISFVTDTRPYIYTARTVTFNLTFNQHNTIYILLAISR